MKLQTKVLQSNKYWLSSDFKEILGDMKSVEKVPIKNLSFTTLTKNTHDSEIVEKVGYMTPEEAVSLVIQLTQKQPNREANQLLTNGYSNIIGYVKLGERVLSVTCCWDSDGEQWDCIAWLPGDWSAGRRFLSRNGSLKPLGSEIGNFDTFPLESAIKVVKDAGYIIYKQI